MIYHTHQYSRRVSLPVSYINLVLGHLRSDDIYHQVSFTAINMNNHLVIIRKIHKSLAICFNINQNDNLDAG